MRLAILTCAAILIGPQPLLIGQSKGRSDEGLPRVSWEAAERVVGELALVVGKIERVGNSGRVHFLNFHRQRRGAFTAVVFEENLGRFPDTLESLYLGKEIQVRGYVTRHRGTPQIRVTSPAQITVLSDPLLAEPRNGRSSRRNSDEIKVATFNVMNLFDDVDDPYYSDELTPSKPQAELRRLGAAIRALNADLLALQEVESRGYLNQFLRTYLSGTGYRHVVLQEGNDLRGIDVALLSRFPVGKVTSHRHLQFLDEAGNRQQFTRDVLRVVVAPRRGSSLELWIVHLKSNSDERAERRRFSEVSQLRAMYEEQLTLDPDSRIIICGDFNDHLESRSLRHLLGSPTNPLRTFVGEIPESSRVTYNREPHRSMIDFILASPAMAERYVAGSYVILPGDVSTTGSDHNPVSARFRWNESPSK